MKLIETKVMRGPNYWSVDQGSLIVLKIQLDDIAESEVNTVMQKAILEIPALSSKHHIQDHVQKGLPLLIKHLAVELQCMAEMPCTYARSRAGSNKGEHFIIVEYTIEEAGVHAAKTALHITEALLKGEPVDIKSHISELNEIRHSRKLGATSADILDAVKERKIPFRRFDNGSLIILGYGNKQQKIRTAVTDSTSGLGIELAGDKEETKKMLAEANVPVPKGILVYSEAGLRERIIEVKFPVVIKPLDGNHGRGVTTNIMDVEKAVFGFTIAKKISKAVILEEYIEGNDYRFLVINFKLIAVAKRTPAFVKGDGKSTIQQLVDEENKNPERGSEEKHVLAIIKIDEVTKKILSEKNLSADSIPASGEIIVLKDTANISAGGTAEDVTETVHPENIFMAERVAKMFNLNICGIDVMAKAVDIPITREVGAVIEVNAGPGLRMHSNPQGGKIRDVASPIVEMMFPTPQHARIPIVAVTGTNGKTTTTRMIAHLAKHAGHTPGFCTTEGIYVDGHMTFEGDCTGYLSAHDVLFDPVVDFAVLECARGGILKSGLGFDHCDISVVTNITEDHLGLKDINTLEDMAKVKSVVARSTTKNGYSILNADNDLSYKIMDDLECNVALFSMKSENERIKEHVKNGGLAATVESGYVIVHKGKTKIQIELIDNIPVTFKGKASYMIKNILPAVLTGIISGFTVDEIQKGLKTFYPSPHLTPGRMNLFDFTRFKVMIDYAHNMDGFFELKRFLDEVEDSPKVGLIAVAGDRRDEDIRHVGLLAATMFDKIIIKHDKDLRGRTAENISELLLEGISQINKAVPTMIISEEKEAIEYALDNAEKGSFILICAGIVSETVDQVSQLYKINSLITQIH
ncbi:MAG: cyanophycin synthetase [Bacteroidetes bacterium]|nr:cyanophycin synthetase [Bacteroidota bacterium]